MPRKVRTRPRAGTVGERHMQRHARTRAQARAFYSGQMRDRLYPAMRKFLARMELMFIATADASGECDSSVRAGPPGFVRVLDERTVAYPEYRGNGVMASLGNIIENGHVGLLLVDFMRSSVGLHLNGPARVVENRDMLARSGLPETIRADCLKARPRVERWVVVEIREAYIHCAKHLPRFKKLPKPIHWGTDSARHKGGDFFQVRPA